MRSNYFTAQDILRRSVTLRWLSSDPGRSAFEPDRSRDRASR